MLGGSVKMSFGIGGGGLMPAVGEQFVQTGLGMTGDAGEYVAEVIEDVDLVAFAGGDEGEEDGGGFAAVVGSQKRPVTATNGNAAQGAFGEIIVDVQLAVGGVNAQSVPLIQYVGDGG